VFKKCVISALFGSIFFFLFSPEIRAGEPVEIMAGRITLKFKENVPDSVRVAFAKDYDLVLIAHSQNTGVCLYQAKDDNVLPLIEKIKINPVIEFVEANYVQKERSVPNDPLYVNQWYLPKIKMPDAWGEFTGTSIIKVAVIDTGVSKYHNEISPILISQGEWDYVDGDSDANDEGDSGHGTLIAGIIAAVKNNGAGISGISDRVRILPIRTADSYGSSDPTENGFAIERAADNGCKVIVCSFGSYNFSSAQNAAISYANSKGALVVCAGGNESINNDINPHYPASYTTANVISVADSISTDALSPYSNYGASSVDISAPGTDIYSTQARKKIAEWKFDYGWDGWDQYVTSGLGFFWGSIGLGLYTDGFGGFYQSNSETILYSPLFACTEFEKVKIRAKFDGRLGTGDSIYIFAYDSQFNSYDLNQISSSDDLERDKGWTFESLYLPKKSGRFAVYFFSDGIFNDFFGLINAEVIGFSTNPVVTSQLFGSASGTSFSAPVVAGVAAMLMSQNPQLTHLQVKDIILQTARKVSALNGKVVSGGVVDAAAALREAKARIVVTPAVTSSTSASAIVGTAFTYSITASGTPTSYNASSLPSGLSVNTSTGVISGSPISAGTFTSSISASNSAGTGSASLTIAIVKFTPTITAAPSASAITFGQSLASSTLSGGSASVTGNFSWTTTSAVPAAGTSAQNVTFTPSDTANYNTATTSVSVTVNKASPSINTAPTASAITYGQTLASSTLSGGSASVAGNFSWTTTSAVPASGTSAQNATFTPSDTANYNTAITSVSVTAIQAPPPPPRGLVITSDLAALSINLGASFSHQITASGSPTSFGAIRLPPGLKINAKSGLISGKPTKVGVSSATLQALKKGSTTATATKVFTVVQAPTFSYAPRINAQRNKNVNVRPKVAGSPAPSFSVVSGSLPPGLGLNASTAAITGTPTTAGSYAFTVRGSNSAGNTDRRTTIVVK
jgi:subtilisin family serine protease